MESFNRYQGNSGCFVRVEESPQKQAPPPAPLQVSQPGRPENPRQPGFMEQLGKLIPGSLGELETEDIILLLILYLMYRESGDSELLIIMGAMFLL